MPRFTDSLLEDRPGRGRLDGLFAIVAGGGSSGPGLGNGRATCLVLAREGATVAVVDLNEEEAQRTVDLIVETGGKAFALTGDLTRESECKRVVEEAVSHSAGSIDILVNSIGVIGPPSSVLDIEESAWDWVMMTNVKPMAMMSKHAIPHMLTGGSIINLSSVAAFRATERAAYAASKKAVIGLTEVMAAHHGVLGVRVNSVSPGMMWTPIAQAEITSEDMREKLRENRKKMVPLKSEGTGWDIAYAVLYLASDESRWVTGQTIVVDGGQILVSRPPSTTAAGLAVGADSTASWEW